MRRVLKVRTNGHLTTVVCQIVSGSPDGPHFEQSYITHVTANERSAQRADLRTRSSIGHDGLARSHFEQSYTTEWGQCSNSRPPDVTSCVLAVRTLSSLTFLYISDWNERRVLKVWTFQAPLTCLVCSFGFWAIMSPYFEQPYMLVHTRRDGNERRVLKILSSRSAGPLGPHFEH